MDQPYLINSHLSQIELDDVSIHDIESDGNIFYVSGTQITIQNSEISNISTMGDGILVFAILDCAVSIDTVTVRDSSVTMLSVQYSNSSLQNIEIYDADTQGNSLMRYSFSDSSTLNNVTIQNVNSSNSGLILSQSTNFDMIYELSVTSVNTTVMNLYRSTINSISQLVVNDSAQAISVESSTISSMIDSQISYCGNYGSGKGAGMYSLDSYISITNSSFTNNMAESGAAMAVECSSYDS